MQKREKTNPEWIDKILELNEEKEQKPLSLTNEQTNNN